MNILNLRRRAWRSAALVLALALMLALVLAAGVAWLNVRGEAPLEAGLPATPASPDLIERGAYLARAGNCMGCHTSLGGTPLAGGRGVETPFGTVFAPNITPDLKTGIGSWSAGEFWRSLHHGRSKDGRLLYPAFPYPSFTQVSREDSDALYAFLRSVPAVEQANTPHALRFPYNTQAALAVWRALYFRPGTFEPEAGQSAEWNRGKYLTQGLGHCAACHSGRDALGGTRLNAAFAGGLMPGAHWYAPSLASPDEAGVQRWPRDQVVRLIKDGVTPHASVSGPMAEVVFSSTQHLSEQDVEAMAIYLASIPVRAKPPVMPRPAEGATMLAGGKVYEQHCAACHGEQGQGAPGMVPALAGNRAVTLDSHINVVQTIRQGGFMPTTAGNRQPFGMPPYGQLLSHDEIAAVATFIRQSWGNAAAPVSALDVLQVD